MPSPAQAEIATLFRQEKDAEQRDRLMSVLMAMEGFKSDEIAPKIGRSIRFVQKWTAIYRQEGLSALRHRPNPGAKSKLSTQQEAEFGAFIQAALQHDASGRIKGREVVRILAEQFGKTYSLPGAYELMARLGLPRRLPRSGSDRQGVASHGVAKPNMSAAVGRWTDLLAMLEAASEGLLWTDMSGKPMIWNRRFAALWRLPPALLAAGDPGPVLAAMLAQVCDPSHFLARTQALEQLSDVTAPETVFLGDGRALEYSFRLCLEAGRPAGRIWSVADVTARVKLENEWREKETNHDRIHNALAALARTVEAMDPLDSDPVFQAIAECLAQTLGVARAGVWLLSDEDTRLSCRGGYDIATGAGGMGVSWLVSGCPHYFAALAQKREISVCNAASDPATYEMAGGYFEPLGIASLLDAPIFVSGRVAGVVRLEHVGATGRHWRGEESLMAAVVAGMAARHLGEKLLHEEESMHAQQRQLASAAASREAPAKGAHGRR